MVAYNIFIAVVIVLLLADSAQRKPFGFFALLAIVIAIAFSTFRDYIGYDYANYVEFYTLSTEKLFNRGLELGYIGVSALLHCFTDDYFWLFFLFGAATIILICKGIFLYTRNFRIAFIIFLLTPGLFLNSFSIIRQSLAIALLFNSFYGYYLGHLRSSLWYAIFSVLMHYSTIFVLPFFAIAPRLARNARTLVLIGIPISLVLAKLKFLSILITFLMGGTKFVAYASYIDQGTPFVKLLALNCVLFLYLFFYKNLDRLGRTLLVVVAIGLMLTNVCADVAALTRIGYFFKIFDCVLIANIVRAVKSPNRRLVIILFVFIYYYALFFNALSVDMALPDFPKLTPYKTIFS